jgi:hypothetical protein
MHLRSTNGDESPPATVIPSAARCDLYLKTSL